MKTGLYLISSLLVVSLAANAYLLYEHISKTQERETEVQAYTERIQSLNESTLEQSRQIADLEKALADIQSTENNPITRLPYTEYTLVDGTEYWATPLTNYEFSVGSATGTVLHVCKNPAGLIQQNNSHFCLADSAYLLRYNNQITVIDEFTFSELGDEKSLQYIAFNEGTLEIATSTDRLDAALLLYENPLTCLWSDGMCLSFPETTYAISFPDRSVITKTIEDIWAMPGNFVWSPDHTKAVYKTACPAGCPEELVVGIDLETRTRTVLQTRSDIEGVFLENELQWLDNNTVLADGVEIVF